MNAASHADQAKDIAAATREIFDSAFEQVQTGPAPAAEPEVEDHPAGAPAEASQLPPPSAQLPPQPETQKVFAPEN